MSKADGPAHLHDTQLGSRFRFLSEVVAWVIGTWAFGTIHPLLGIVALILMIGLPTVFTTIGDKKHMVIPTPGPIRALIDFLQFAVAVIAPWFVLSTWAAMICGTIVIAAIVFGRKRYLWLIRGALLDD